MSVSEPVRLHEEADSKWKNDRMSVNKSVRLYEEADSK